MRLNALFIFIFATSCAHQATKVTAFQKHSPLSQNEKENLELSSDYLKASYLMMRGKHGQSKTYLQNLANNPKLALDPVPRSFLETKLALTHIRMGDLNDAVELLERVFERQNYKVEKVGLLYAGILSGLQKEKESEQVYRKILSIFPASETACTYLANSLIGRDQIDKGLEALTGCFKVDNQLGFVALQIAKIYQVKAQSKKAKKFFQAALELQGSSSQAALDYASFMEEQKKESGIAFLKSFLEKNPEDDGVISELMEHHFKNERFEKALSLAERLVDLWPHNLGLQVKLGVLYEKLGKLPSALKVFKALLENAPHSDKLQFQVAHLLRDQGLLEESLSYFSGMSEESELYEESIFQAGKILGELALFKTSFEKEFEIFVNTHGAPGKTNRRRLLYIQASYLAEKKDNLAALGVLGILNSESALNSHQSIFMASLYEEELDFKRAEEVIREVIKNDPSNAQAYNFLGYSLLEREEHLELAFDYINRAVELSPENGHIRDSLGWYYYKAGDFKRSLKEMTLAVKLAPNVAEINKHMALVYWKLNQNSMAKKFLQLALSQSTSEEERNEVSLLLEKWNQAKRLPASLKITTGR